MIRSVLENKFLPALGCAALALALVFAGCSSSTTPPLSAFQPEIANNPDNFQFQATGVTNVSTTVIYFWSNSGTKAKVNQSSAITGGAADVVLLEGRPCAKQGRRHRPNPRLERGV